jgi:hypothetical protein
VYNAGRVSVGLKQIDTFKDVFIIPSAESVVFWAIIIIVRAVILPVVLYQIVTWSLAIREEC